MPESRRYRIAIHAAAILISLVFLLPFAWLVIASLASQADLLKLPLSFIPSHLSFSRYTQIFTSQSGTIFANFRASLINSLIIATSTVAISITVGSRRPTRVVTATASRAAGSGARPPERPRSRTSGHASSGSLAASRVSVPRTTREALPVATAIPPLLEQVLPY